MEIECEMTMKMVARQYLILVCDRDISIGEIEVDGEAYHFRAGQANLDKKTKNLSRENYEWTYIYENVSGEF